MIRLPGTEPILMREIEDLKQEVPHCPHCGSLDLQRNNGLVECNHCPWMGRDDEVGMHRAIAMNDEYDLHRPSFYQSPEIEWLSWPNKIGRFARSLWKSPKKSLIVLLQHERSHRWRMGNINNNPAMQIIADYYLTNITQEDLFVLKTYFVPYECKGWFPSTLPVEGNVFVKNHVVAGGAPGKHKIPPGFTFEGHADWWIQPPIKSEGQTLIGRSCFVDQFENEHWTAVIKWKYREKGEEEKS
jgi:hypothetical protein